jgi:prevent-host-death family protein
MLPSSPHVVNIHHAKTHLSQLLVRVAGGEEIVIAKNGVPCARLVPFSTEHTPRKPGLFHFTVPNTFFEELPADELGAWEEDDL